ncbi:hydroxymethylpyrimidine/phosphomethylpyrimidine kinase [Parasedimentitalea maritima]|uniref:hydroxymethylpyrimidine kinase n=1 Tax=Parasedimentitalea maritima TaxID=2578117 RepID=A0ABY2UUI2_9RHOB|nr:hydroxymethylpyrimidine/phosphomethylpyrimidine kinase [Zongyanglinia marina]TLP62774.1 hydroxymethylpyrimidine/phosphomethylpyrimidine kinase [Zongyanglinia marina]
MNNILAIAGTDSSGGAGLTRDSATAQELGFRVKPVVTSVTVQTDKSFIDSHAVPPPVIKAQLEAALQGTKPAAVKIGMLGTAETAGTVLSSLSGYCGPVILDPVLKSSSGGTLFSGRDIYRLFAITTVLTPNLDEAAILTSRAKASDEDEVKKQAEILLAQGAAAVLIKGGHADGFDCVDHVFSPEHHVRLVAPRLTQAKRGTGCTLSTAIACNLASGHNLSEACRLAKDYVHQWLQR